MPERLITRALRFLRNNSPVHLDWRINPYLFNPNRDFPETQYKAIGYKPTGMILDIGSGQRPFPSAQFLVDKYEQPLGKKPVILGGQTFIPHVDICDLRIFANKYFDFVFCSRVLEHTDDPIKACQEIIRVGKRGYIETPRIGTDALFSWNNESHKWLVHNVNNTLVFFPNTDFLRAGIRSTAWRDVLSSPLRHPLQNAFFKNQGVFNVMFNWKDQFNVIVFEDNGEVKELHV